MHTDIASPTPEIACHLKRWTRNRDVISGEDAVKAAGQAYLPKLPSQTADDYTAYNASVDYFPGAMRTHEGHIGLIFRKNPTRVGGDVYEDILNTISPRHSLDQLARELVSETLITNFTGLLVDSPAQPEGLSKAVAIADGYRPLIALYRAESILEITPAIIRNRWAIVRVRLLDDADTVRELRLSNGIYEVVMHRRTDSGWVEEAPVVPKANGAPMTAIPFKLVSTTPGSFEPTKAPLDDLCLLNLAHFRASAQYSNVLRHLASPVRYATGVDDVNAAYVVSPDSMWLYSSKDTKVDILEHSGAGVDSLKARCDGIKDEMAAIGARILQSEKAAAEAAETLAIRRAAEGSIMTAIAKSVSDQLEAQVNVVMARLGGEEVSYSLNTDFMPVALSAQDITALVSAWQAGAFSHETLIGVLKSGEVIDDAIDFETEKSRLQQDQIDAPPVTAL